MLDILLLRKDLDSVVARLQTRKNPQQFLNVEAFKALEAERKTIQTRTEDLQAKRNQLSKQIGMLMGKGEKDAAEAAKVEVGQIVHLSDLKLPKGVELVALAHGSDLPVANIHMPRVQAAEEGEGEGAAE